ncbi:hypothetical protein PMAYCL1PPCAC_16328, partial [Pristionchus mayeri]
YSLARTYQLRENVTMMEMMLFILGSALIISSPAFLFRAAYLFLPPTQQYELIRGIGAAIFDLWITLVCALMTFVFPLFNYRFRKPAFRYLIYRLILNRFNRR